eukprot:CAMPEP_0197465516 /NCGR_PEP_ID=MMETSP1175-20131217/64582_1 /TAXON_ID=1003142 /ORGANISM="Triceratium dubium, Strain CCMP147" /LENGTH=2057 /DNA_ID=CAMNT_0043001533 /DNA_START=366 /DNA_END=6539 /DNA_ORIENTATION=-
MRAKAEGGHKYRVEDGVPPLLPEDPTTVDTSKEEHDSPHPSLVKDTVPLIRKQLREEDIAVRDMLRDLITEMEDALHQPDGEGGSGSIFVGARAEDWASIASDNTAAADDPLAIVPLLLTTTAVALVLYLLVRGAGGRRCHSRTSLGSGNGQTLLSESEWKERREHMAIMAEERRRIVAPHTSAKRYVANCGNKSLTKKEVTSRQESKAAEESLGLRSSKKEKRSGSSSVSKRFSPERGGAALVMKTEDASRPASLPPPPSKPPPSQPAPPAQILCEGLAAVCELNVRVKGVINTLPTGGEEDETSKDGSGSGGSSGDKNVASRGGSRHSWAGCGWKKRSSCRGRLRHNACDSPLKGFGDSDRSTKKAPEKVAVVDLLRFAPPRSDDEHRSTEESADGSGSLGGDGGNGVNGVKSACKAQLGNVADGKERHNGRSSSDLDDVCRRENDWSDLCSAISSLLCSSSPDDNPFRNHLLLAEGPGLLWTEKKFKKRPSSSTSMMHRAASWYSRACSVPRNEHTDGGLSDVDQSGLAACLYEVGAFAVRVAAGEVRQQVRREGLGYRCSITATATEAGDNGASGDLFEDVYSTRGHTLSDEERRWGGEGGSPSLEEVDPWACVAGDGPFKELLRLLEAGPPSISGRFTSALISAYDSLDGDAMDEVRKAAALKLEDVSGLADILLAALFWASGAPGDSGVPWEVESFARRRLIAISHAVTISPEIAGAIARRLGDEVQITSTFSECDEGGCDNNKQKRYGRRFEEQSILRDVLRLAGNAVPEVGMESATPSPSSLARATGVVASTELQGSFRNHILLRALDSIPQFPLCVYDRRQVVPPTNMERRMMYRRGEQGGRVSEASVYDASRGREEVSKAIEATRHLMSTARTTMVLVLKKSMAAEKKVEVEGCAAKRKKTRSNVLRWIGTLVEFNEELVYLLETDLLSSGSVQASCSSRSFLIGTVASLLALCSRSLTEKFENESSQKGGGVGAFDANYTRGNSIVAPPKERRLVTPLRTRDCFQAEQERFAGATELFFLIGALLRQSLFHALRVHNEFRSKYKSIFSALDRAAARLPPGGRYPSGALSANLPRELVRPAGVELAFTAALDDPFLVKTMTEFSLLQLRWLADAAEGKGWDNVTKMLSLVPEWLCKLPSQWIAHVATLPSPHSAIDLFQGEEAVRCATRILKAASRGAAASGSGFMDRDRDPSKKKQGSGTAPSNKLDLSPPVLTQLIRIAGAFVRSGVNRARTRYLSKHHRKGCVNTSAEGSSDENDDILFDERNLDIYATFDSNDLGVTVFSSRFVANELCPTLMEAFMAMNAVEGVDVEREHHFHKNQVQSEICELILRLWSHPVGDCRLSICRLNGNFLSRFVSALVAEFGMILDEGLHKAVDVRNLLGGVNMRISLLGARERVYYDFLAEAFGGALSGARRLLLLLTYLSEEESIASVLGGGTVASSQAAAVFVHFMDLFTAEDGGTNPDLDFRCSRVPTSKLIENFKAMLPKERERYVTDLLQARQYVWKEFGLDCSIMAHWLLALATRWHRAAAKGDRCEKTSSFMNAVASNEDCNIEQIRNVLKRLVVAGEDEAIAVTSPEAIFEQDGHVEAVLVDKGTMQRDFGAGLSRRHAAKQDQMTHNKINHLASIEDVSNFFCYLEEAVSTKAHNASNAELGSSTEMERMIFSPSIQNTLTNDDYSDLLRDWIVSSESFLSPSGDGSYAHSYNSLAQRGTVNSAGPGKILVKEARKCHKNIPQPHPNSSIFVCFGEERMDLCRAVIVGAVDTPYSLGMFEFDIFFPATYPGIAPLVTFKTTGGGTVRFSANLYTEGKVCISVLGTTQAWNESQRWNPASSSLVQVLMSLQTQVLGISDPFFGEGFGHESQVDSRVGQEGAKRYHNGLRLATLRHAIISQIKHPPVGMEEVVQKHFSLCRRRVIVQARRWMLEAKGSVLFPRFQRAYNNLVALLSSETFGRRGGESCGYDTARELPPNQDDVKLLEILDPTFVSDFSLRCGAKDSNEMGCAAPDCHDSYNPWVDLSGTTGNRSYGTGVNEASGKVSADPDDELYD